jgi:hypothetical protein
MSDLISEQLGFLPQPGQQPQVWDLSQAQAPPEPSWGTLTETELGELIEAISETDADELAGQLSGDLPDAELDAIVAAAEALADEADAGAGRDAALGQYNEVFTNHVAAEQQRQQARAEADLADLMHPPRTDEDKVARALQRIQAGIYDVPQPLSAPAIRAGGREPCGPPDSYGRCSSRYHGLDCLHGISTDWMASGPSRAAYESRLAMANQPDPQDWQPPVIPARAVELARQMSAGLGDGGVPSWDDLLGSEPGDLYAGLADGAEPVRPAYPGISELRQRLGL